MLKRDRDKLVQVAARVERLRAELKEAELELDEVLSLAGGEDSVQLVETGSVPERVLTLLNASPLKTFSAKQIKESLDIENLQSLRSTLSRMVRDEALESKARGQYRAVVEVVDDDAFGIDELPFPIRRDSERSEALFPEETEEEAPF